MLHRAERLDRRGEHRRVVALQAFREALDHVAVEHRGRVADRGDLIGRLAGLERGVELRDRRLDDLGAGRFRLRRLREQRGGESESEEP
ncbi:MAG: hypothetical protein K8S98_14710 [Planctomycetes bacterium]|nr:hypothetical protein [Planctomycetota bacterium]